MRVTVSSDQHGHLIPQAECDLLLLAGDIAPIMPAINQLEWVEKSLIPWLKAQPAKHIVAVAGNHDLWAKDAESYARSLPWTYLLNEATDVEGFTIWGSPYAVQYGPFPFMRKDAALVEIWEKIPSEVNILMTHGPAYGYRDTADNMREQAKVDPRADVHVGSRTLRNRIDYGGYDDLMIVATGHIHEAWGHERARGITYVNASYVNRRMRPQNPSVSFDLVMTRR